MYTTCCLYLYEVKEYFLLSFAVEFGNISGNGCSWKAQDRSNNNREICVFTAQSRYKEWEGVSFLFFICSIFFDTNVN